MYIYLHQSAYYRPYNPLNLPWFTVSPQMETNNQTTEVVKNGTFVNNTLSMK